MYALDQLAPQSKVWIYQSERVFTPKESQTIDQELEQFVTQWAAHGRNLKSYGRLHHGQFVVLAVDESSQGASGCSIDSSVRFLKTLQTEYATNLFNRMLISYRDAAGHIQTTDRKGFKALVANGVVNKDTIVFNNLVATKADLEQKWECPVAESWHKMLL